MVLVVGVLLEVLASDQDVPLALAVPVGLAMTVPLLWGQRQPVLVAVVVLGAWLLQAYAGDWELEPQSALLPVCLVFWSLGAQLGRTPAAWACGLGLAALVLHQPDDAIVLVPLMAGVFAGGRLMRSRELLARELAAERAQAERYAVAAERARIARELHDVVGHAVSLMTVQAGAERLTLERSAAPARPETAQVLGQIEQTGRRTMQEMRRMLDVLRAADPETDLAPQPGLAGLDQLVAQFRATGLEVTVRAEGAPAELSPGADISAYRIVQQALTNVLQHAGAERATVSVVHRPTEVEIAVEDDGIGRTAQQRHGHGITGMRERVTLFGGTLEAGPGAAGGWRVVARLPREATP